MTATIHPQLTALPEQRLILPLSMTWEQFKTLESLLEYTRSIRLSYLDGYVEIITRSSKHEIIKYMAGMLGQFFLEKDISFTPTGSATLQGEAKGSSKEPDLSYYFGEDRRGRETPDLAIEVIFILRTINKLEYYRRFNVAEVWFWEDGVFSIYQLKSEGYDRTSRSVLLPDLDLELLGRCLQMSEEKEAFKLFRDAVRCC
ncbi:Uma2 family endonuclease [Microcoleus sp. LEGE 07076]|uniref:Uma2 family endonuclease n=1 Tax=Microcoleus sp. LEGE 07076 TaxID=915322 RepID=UPI001882ADC4|nr:Uma2 family endonuclease [Microcoleus sp. LEGE 07076]MBE9186891.1 Uma2 family endonuclease [Microcoleus sp. LEGE 07076]